MTTTPPDLAAVAQEYGIDLSTVIDPAKLAIALVETGKVSTYKAAELCGISRATIFNRRDK